MSSTETKDRVWDKKVFEKIICLENLLLEGKETAEKNKLVRVVKNLVSKKNCAGKKESGENNLMFTIEIVQLKICILLRKDRVRESIY
ncbi:hypothetical protein CWI39_0077p0010 [Hamiltosporidium magnivora]|uniref:Uncharacterized protein n=1 Tax=Hamiltosporidium magnivora TaxID=148818 RepID=A0A4Q9LMN8_9MICR|nr:hypothetical protein CWI39_0077p0010 [Hamiltosporidium magnivora]